MARIGIATVLCALVVVSGGAIVVASGLGAAKTGPSGSLGVGSCPSSSSISGYKQSSDVGAAVNKASKAWAYYVTSLTNTAPVGGVPGVTEYCVYPSNSTSPATITPTGRGSNGVAFGTVQNTSAGFFGFARGGTNDSSNIALNGLHDMKVGQVTWTTVPGNETILVQLHDPAECAGLYGANSSSTCFVYPVGWLTPLCGGEPACKTVTIAQATSSSPLTVPADTVLNITYTYTIVDQPNYYANMVFYAKNGTTTGANTTGINDFFTCEQILDPSGSPGTYGVHTNYEGTGFALLAVKGPGTCARTNITLVAVGSNVLLHSGDFITFTVDMTTKSHGFTGPGVHCINTGVIVKWIPSMCMTMMQTYVSPMIDVTVA